MKKKGKKILSLLLAVLMLVGLAVPTGILAPAAKAAAGDPPAHGKTASDNGDGTTKLSLSVTGDADYDAEPVKANVILIVDTSGSMDYSFPSDTGSRGSDNANGRDSYALYKRTGTGGNATYTEITDDEAYTGTVYNRYYGRYYEYTGQRFLNQTRMSSTKESVNNLIDTLFSQNTTDVTDVMEIALITFESDGHYNTPSSATADNWVSGVSTGTAATNLKNTVNGLDADGGTNWDDALYRADALAAAKANAQPNETVYIVFFSDGEPTFSNTNNNNDSPTSHSHGNNSNYSSGGSTTEAREYNSAYYHANQIYKATYKSALYGIFAFGTVETYMKTTVSYGNYGDATHADDVAGSLYFNANSPEDIEAAFKAIATSIVEAVGITDVSIKDGTTNKVETSTGVSAELLEVDDQSFEYWLTWRVGDENKFKSFIGGEVVECTAAVNGDNINITWDGGSATYEGTLTGGVVKVKWTDKTDFYNFDPPKAEFNESTGAVDWKLNDVGTLLNGVTYTVTFDVYPSQDALDIVADIKNNPGEEGAWGDLDSAIQNYITPDGEIRTNTNATLTYSDTRLTDPGPKETSFTNPDPVEAKAIEEVGVTKDWANVLDNADEEDGQKPPVILTMKRDGVDIDPNKKYTVELNNDNSWTDTVFISVGIIKNGQVMEGSEGHDFSFVEPQGLTYHWELNAPVMHPMLVDGERTMLIKVDDKHPLPDGATTYTIKGATYYVRDESTDLIVTNERRSRLNLSKVVEGAGADPDQTFPFTLKVVNSLAPSAAPSAQEDPNHDSDWWVWFSVWNGGYVDAVVSGATKEMKDGEWTGYYYAPHNTDISLNLKNGDGLRVLNLPSDSTYTITEGTLPANYTFVSSKLTAGTDSTFSGSQTTTGKIEDTNTDYKVTYTNDYALSAVKIEKTFSSIPSTLIPAGFQIGVQYSYPDGSDAPDPAPPAVLKTSDTGVEVSEDGLTFTWTISDLPVGTTVTATESGTDATGGYVLDEDATKSGNATTTKNTVEKISLSNPYTYTANGSVTLEVTKEIAGAAWPSGKTLTLTLTGANGAPMPETTTASLTAAGDASFGPIAYTDADDGKTYTYTITENGFGTGWSSTPTTGAITATVKVTDNGDGTLKTEVTYSPEDQKITNTYAASGTATITVTKAIAGAAWPSDKTLTLTLTGTGTAPMPTTTTATLSAEGNVSFGPIAYTEADAGQTYTYTISEDGFGTGWSGSGNVTATVKVTDNGDGTLATEVTYTPTDATITNTYKADGTATIIVTKALAGAGWPEGKTLTFTLSGTGDAPMPKTTTATLTAAGNASFGPIQYTEADAGKTYTYTITEDGFGTGWTGSGDVTATVTVTDAGEGKLTTEVKYSPDTATITNTYKATGEAVLEVTKALEGAAWPSGKTLTFTLSGTGGTLPDAKTATLTAEGKATFDAITYTEADIDKTYTYTITEDGFGKGWTGSGDVTATVKVTDNGDGTLAAEVTYTNEDTITNTYKATGEAVLEVTKKLEGAAWPSGKTLTFTLSGTGGTLPDAKTATLTAEGTAKFAAITYTEADIDKEYTYVISEDGFGTGWTGSGNVTATVKVTDNGDGTLATEVSYTNEDTITNTYSADGEATITVTKALSGAVWPEGKTLTLTLSGTGDAPMPKTTTATLTAAGNASFGPIQYTEADAGKTYTYTITEDGFGKGWTSSGDVTATVTVTDAGEGKLTAEVKYSPENATITNKYSVKEITVDPKDTATTFGTKSLTATSEDGKAQTFAFTLTAETAGAPMPGEGATASLTYEAGKTGDQIIPFGTITYTEPGTYEYSITETKLGNGWSTTGSPAKVTVVITDNGDGTLSAEVTGSTITNKYAPGEITVDPKDTATTFGTKSLTATTADGKAQTFEFTLTAETAGAPMPSEGATASLTYEAGKTGDQIIPFGTITYTEPGTYEYSIAETKLGNGWSTTGSPAKVTVVITDNGDGTLSAEVTGGTITNAYAAKEITVDPKDISTTFGTKSLTATTEDGNAQTFEFTLTAETTGAPMPESATASLTYEAGKTGDQIIPFGTITYAAPGTYEYSITETKLGDGWSTTGSPAKVTVVITDNGDGTLSAKVTGSTITNKYTPGKQLLSVEKIWDDAENNDNLRPESIDVNLLLNGKICETQTLSESNGWKYSWEVPDSKDLIYTVDEDVVPAGYSCSISGSAETGYTITNTHMAEMVTPFTVTKVWDDNNNQYGVRPASITVKLMANGQEAAAATLSEANNWTFTFKDLPKNANSRQIDYTVEEAAVANYTSTVTGSATGGFVITNACTYLPPSPPPIAEIRIRIVKQWEDNGNEAGKRPDSVTVTLLRNTEVVDVKQLNDSNGWQCERAAVDGFSYSVIEDPVDGYETSIERSYDGSVLTFTVINKLAETPELNTRDHVAYIVGYPDGTVRPGREITRAEVATIFFRLLTNEARDQYWSQTNPYPDVELDDWFNNAISTLTNMGIINGYEDGTFRPNNPITRAELTKIAVSFFTTADRYYGRQSSFSDVPADAWYSRFIAAAEELGLINGYPDGTFRPNNFITRAETCTIVNRTLGRVPHKDHLLPYLQMINWPDNANVDAWYYAQIQEATNSHDFVWTDDEIAATVEQWTAKLPERDWVALEQIWSNAHSAPGGEVMGLIGPDPNPGNGN